MAKVTKVVFNGPDNDFFDTAFFAPGTGAFEIFPRSTAVQHAIYEQPGTGAVTVINGQNMLYDLNGVPVSGTVTGMSFTQGGVTVATITGLSWDITELFGALHDAGTGDDTRLDDLLTSQRVKVNASAATVGLDFDGSDIAHRVAVSGSDHNDKIVLGKSNDYVHGGAGNDKAFGLQGSDVMRGGYGRDKFDGGKGDDQLYGGNHADRLRGGFGNDFLDGGKGRDTLDGGAGDDYMIGGPGADVFVFNRKGGFDWIEDFEDGVDLIDFSALGIGFSDLSITDAGGFGETSIVYGSIDIVLTNTHFLDFTAADFIFV